MFFLSSPWKIGSSKMVLYFTRIPLIQSGIQILTFQPTWTCQYLVGILISFISLSPNFPVSQGGKKSPSSEVAGVAGLCDSMVSRSVKRLWKPMDLGIYIYGQPPPKIYLSHFLMVFVCIQYIYILPTPPPPKLTDFCTLKDARK